MISECFFSSRQAMLDKLTNTIATQLQTAVEQRGQAILLVSGGSTPKPVYEALSAWPLDWSKIVVVLVDERWVSLAHPASNEAFIRRHLLVNHAAQAKLIPLKTEHHSAQSAREDCEQRLAVLPELPDVCVLGMGNDGHTASLFPHAEGLENGLDQATDSRCVAIKAKQSEVTGEHTERMSLNFSYLRKARHTFLLMTGDEKRACYQTALAGKDVMEMPIRAFFNDDELQVNVYWAA